MNARRRLEGAALSILLCGLVGCEQDGAGGAEAESGEPTCGQGADLSADLESCAFDAEGSWTWVRESPEAWRVDEAGLELQSLGGTLWEDANDNRNVALRGTPGSFPGTTSLRVDGALSNDGEQAGLLWYGGDDDYIKLVKEQVLGNAMVILVAEKGGRASVLGFGTLDANAAELQLAAEGGELVASWRQAGATDYVEIGRTELELGVPAQIGLYTHGATPEDGRWVRFSGFLVESGL